MLPAHGPFVQLMKCQPGSAGLATIVSDPGPNSAVNVSEAVALPSGVSIRTRHPSANSKHRPPRAMPEVPVKGAEAG